MLNMGQRFCRKAKISRRLGLFSMLAIAVTLLVGTPVFAQEFHYFRLEINGGVLLNPNVPEVSILRAQCRERDDGIELDVDGAVHTPANAQVTFSNADAPGVVYGNATGVPDGTTPTIGVYSFSLEENPTFLVCPTRITATMTGASTTSDVAVRAVAPPVLVPLKLEGPISAVVDNGDGSGQLTMMGITVQIPAGTPIHNPTTSLTMQQFADPTPLPGRTSPGFIDGTAIVTGRVENGTPIAEDVFTEPAENVLLGLVTSAGPGDALTVLGTPLLRLTDPRMLAFPPLNDFGFPIDLAQGGIVGALASVEGYFGQVSVFDEIIITSTPITTARVGQLYSYDVNATGPAGAVLTYSLDVFPAGMTINSSTGLIQWTPAANQVGPQNVTVRVSSEALFALQSFTINVTLDNVPPIANNDSVGAVSGAPVDINVIANDTDPDGTIDPASVAIVTPPANGTAVIDAELDGTVTYTPNAAFVGTDTFTYTVRDNNGAISNTATVTVTVTASAATITIDRAEFRADQARWVIRGSVAPAVQGTTVTVRLDRTNQVIATNVPVVLGLWNVGVRGSAVTAQPGDTISATASNGATITGVAVQVR